MLESIRRVLYLSLALGLFMIIGSANAAGLMTPADGSKPPLRIRAHHVEVTIEDGYAITEIDQVFHNPHGIDLEAYYSFPVPEKGTVAEFTVWIDGQPVTGEVLKKEKAREVYEQEKAAGRDAGLTEKDEYRTFDVLVSPVRAGQDTRVRLVYMQPAFVDMSVGRYVYPLEEGGVDEQKLAFWSGDTVVSESFSFNLTLRSGYPIDALRLPKHGNAQVQQVSESEWKVSLSSQASAPATAAGLVVEEESSDSTQRIAAATVQGPGNQAFSLDQDIVVYWRHREGLPGAVDLVAYRPQGESRGTFMMTVTPGGDLPPITSGTDWVFVLDISGSMAAKIATLADGVVKAMQKMRPDDRFNIVLFNDNARPLTGGFVPATEENVRHYAAEVSRLQSGGSTNLYAGLEMGMKSLDADRPTGIILVTDGVANVGTVEQKAFLRLLESHDVRLFTAIMGNSANRPLLTALTDASDGFAVSVSNSDDIVGKILQATAKVTRHAMNDVEIKIDGVKTADLTPKRIGSVYYGRQIVLLGHYWGDGPADVTLKARVGGTPVEYSTRFEFPASGGQNPELERLWAYASIQELEREAENFGDSGDIRKAVTDLGLEYGLVTNETSMVVMREEMFQQHGIDRSNAQRRQLERAAQAQRQQQPARSNRADSSQPMFRDEPRHSVGGGGSGGAGAVSPWLVLLLIPLLFAMPRVRRLA